MSSYAPPTAGCATCGGPLSSGFCPVCAPRPPFREVTSETTPAQQFGDYELLKEVGRGGMSIVYCARQRRLNRTVALKILQESALPGENLAGRFRQEGEAAARLHHPHIVSVYEIGEAEGKWYLSMELLACSLAEKLHAGPMPPSEAAQLVAKIARAVQHAHDRGVLHRDLKPGNILLDEAGEPRVGDFGLARLLETDSSLTVAGALLGTPAYMSPEQAAGEECTIAADVYSLGTILYETLAGAPPFDAPSALETLRAIADNDPPPLKNVPADLALVVHKCLEKEPATRYLSALALAQELERWLGGESLEVRPSSAPERLRKWMRRKPAWAALWATAVAAFLVISIGGGILTVRLAHQRRLAEAATQDALHRLSAQHSQAAVYLLEANDSLRALLYLAEAIELGTDDPTRDRVNRIRFAALVRFAPRLVQFRSWPDTGRLRANFFGRNGEYLLVLQDHELQLYDAFQGRALGPLLRHTVELEAAALTQDGTRALGGTEDGVWTLWDPRSGAQIAQGKGRLRQELGPQNVVVNGTFAGDRFVVTSGQEARLYRTLTGEQVEPAFLHEAPVAWAVLCPDAQHLITFTETGELNVWDRATSQRCFPPLKMDVETNPAALDDTTNELLLQHGRTDLTVLNYETGEVQLRQRLPETALAHGYNDDHVPLSATRQSDGVAVRDTRSGFSMGSALHGSRGRAASFDAHGRTAVTMAWNGSALFWDVRGGIPISPLLWCAGISQGCDVNREGRVAVMRSNLKGLWLWSRPIGDGGVPLHLPSAPVSVAVSAEESRVLIHLESGDDLAYTMQGASVPGSLAPVASLLSKEEEKGRCLSPDGRQELRWGGRAGELGMTEVHLVNVATGLDAIPPLVHRGITRDASFSPDGRVIATANEDQTVRLWDAATGTARGAPLFHPAPVSRVRFSPDGLLLATNWGGNFARVWAAGNGLPVTPPLPHSKVTELTWSPDSQWLATWGRGNVVRLWGMQPATESAAELRRRAQLLSSHRLEAGSEVGLVDLSAAELETAWREASPGLERSKPVLAPEAVAASAKKF